MIQSRVMSAKQAYRKGLAYYIEQNPDACLTAKRELESMDRTWSRIEREGVQVGDHWIGIRIAAKFLGIKNTDQSWKAYLHGAPVVRGSLGGPTPSRSIGG